MILYLYLISGGFPNCLTVNIKAMETSGYSSVKSDITNLLYPVIAPFMDVIADKIVERLTSVGKEPKFYTREETAKLLRVTLPTLARLTKDGVISAKRIGGRILYDAEAIDEAVKKECVFKYRRAKKGGKV